MTSDVSSDSAGGAVWTLFTLQILIIVLGLLYFGGAFKSKKEVDINIIKPGFFLSIPSSDTQRRASVGRRFRGMRAHF